MLMPPERCILARVLREAVGMIVNKVLGLAFMKNRGGER